jgi:predicted RNase H-like nuclease (RuvC/YqgF family)
MINIIIQKIVTDRRPHDNTDDFSSTFGMAVGTVFQNFTDLNRLKGIEREANDLKEQYERLSSEKDALENEVQKLRIVPSQLDFEALLQQNNHLQKENDSIRDVLKTSKETIAMLQDRLAEAEKSANNVIVHEEVKNLERKSLDERVKQRNLPYLPSMTNA